MNLEKYIDKTVTVYKAAYSKIDDWNNAKKAAMAKYKVDAQRLTRDAANEEYSKIIREYSDMLKSILDELKNGASSVEAEFDQELKTFYTPNGAAIDASDQALLASGILTADEITTMIFKHAENPTMERVINKYVIENGMKDIPTDALKAMSRAASGGANEQRAFNTFKALLNSPVRIAEQGLADSEAFKTAALRADEYAKNAKIDLLKAKLAMTEEDKANVERALSE